MEQEQESVPQKGTAVSLCGKIPSAGTTLPPSGTSVLMDGTEAWPKKLRQVVIVVPQDIMVVLKYCQRVLILSWMVKQYVQMHKNTPRWDRRRH